MQTTLTATQSRHDHPPQPSLAQVRRVGLVDRLALRIGIALITWGRRPRTIETRERRANHIEQELARLERERLNERVLRLMIPPR